MSDFGDSLPLICCCVAGFIIVVPFSVLVLVLVLKGRRSSWRGEIVDKMRKTGRDEDGNAVEYYTIIVKTDTGKTVKVAVSLAEFNGYKVGDKLVKESGTFKPQKVN
jgi:hypothetical protein